MRMRGYGSVYGGYVMLGTAWKLTCRSSGRPVRVALLLSRDNERGDVQSWERFSWAFAS